MDENFVDPGMIDAEIAQRAILKWAMDCYSYTDRSTEDVKPLFNLMPHSYFGKYAKIAEWFAKNGAQYTPEFAHYGKKEGILKEYTSLLESAMFCVDPYPECKILARIALGNAAGRPDVIDALKKYEEIVNRINEMRTGSAARKYSGVSVFTDLHEELHEKHEKGDFDALSGYSTGMPNLDRLTDGLRKGTVTRLSAYANTGKSKFSYQLTNNLLKQWAKVLYFSLEVGKREVALNLSAHWFEKDYYVLAKWREIPDLSKYPIDSLTIVDKIRDLEELESVVAKLKPDCVVIDFVQKIQVKGTKSEYDRLTEAAYRIQDMAVRENVMVFDLSQVSNDGKEFVHGSVIPSKGSGELVSAGDVCLVLTKSKMDRFLDLHLAKNKFGRNNVSLYVQPDFSKSSFEEKGIIGECTL